jgi:hypothetical protein
MAGTLSRYERTRCFRLGWLFERSGWAAMALIIGGAAAGVFGGGALSSVEASAGETLTVRYPRFARAHAPLEVEVEWTPLERSAAIWIARAYLEEFEVEEVLPAPAETTFDGRRIYYMFRAAAPNERVRVAFRLRPERGGRLVGSLGIGAEASVELRQLVFP